MAYQGIGTGTTPNDNTGDSLLEGAVKVNSNFQEIYSALGDGTNINFELKPATTDTTSFVKLADAEKLRSTDNIFGENDTDRNTEIDSDPEVVTLRGLNYWARSNGVVTRRLEQLEVWVVPNNAVKGGTYTFNGTSYLLEEDPNRTGADLFVTNPEDPARAVTLQSAVEYSNTLLSTFDTCIYRLANGPYYDSSLLLIVEFNHNALVVGSPNSFSQNVTIKDYTNANTTPNTDVKSLQDNLEVPCFATKVVINTNESEERLTVRGYPSITLRFNEGGRLDGICWTRVQDTLKDRNNYPDEIYQSDLRPYRQQAVSLIGSSSQNILEDYIDLSVSEFYGTEEVQLDKFWGNPTIEVQGNILIRNCIFGAKSAGLGFVSYGNLGPIIFIQGDCDLDIYGVYLFGNAIVQSLSRIENNSNVTILPTRSDEIYGIKNAQSFIGGKTRTSKSVKLTLQFTGDETINASPVGDGERNIDINCIHILDNDGYYGRKIRTNSSNLDRRGATFFQVIGDFSSNSNIFSGGFSSYKTGFTYPGFNHGFAGVFGSYFNGKLSDANDGYGPRGVSSSLDPISHYRFDSYHGSLWQQANPPYPGTPPENVIRLTYDPNVIDRTTIGPGEHAQAYESSISGVNNELNINSYVYRKGINIETADVVGGDLENNYFYA